jgi:hypothetical protein
LVCLFILRLLSKHGKRKQEVMDGKNKTVTRAEIM